MLIKTFVIQNKKLSVEIFLELMLSWITHDLDFEIYIWTNGRVVNAKTFTGVDSVGRHTQYNMIFKKSVKQFYNLFL